MRKAALNIVGALIVVGLILAAASSVLTQDEPPRVSEPLEASQGQAGGAAPSPVIVLDSKGQEVGPFFPDIDAVLKIDAALLKIDGLSFLLGVSNAGFASSTRGHMFYYTTRNCTGSAFIQVDPGALVLDTRFGFYANVAAGVLSYPTPGSPQKIVSHSDTNENTGVCEIATFTLTASPVKTFKLSTLGFVPPFHVSP